jgi:hypothetical protein
MIISLRLESETAVHIPAGELLRRGKIILPVALSCNVALHLLHNATLLYYVRVLSPPLFHGS